MNDRSWMTAEAVENKAAALASMIRISREEPSQELRRRNKATVDTLARADCYWMASDIWRAIVESSRDLPLDFVFSDDIAPTPYGWIWFEKAWDIPGGTMHCHPEAQDIQLISGVCGLTWGVGLAYGSSEPVLAVETFHRAVTGRLIALYYTYTKPPRSVAAEECRRHKELLSIGRAEDDVPLHALMRAVLGMFLWVKQTICVSRSVVLERHAAKRLARVEMQKALNVIVLRRAQRESLKSDDVSGLVEWSCRWLVRGHWRRQYHPSTEERQPIYILPHVKGPDDKPLKVPTHTVYQVSR